MGLLMPTEASATKSPNEARVLDFARAFRSAARAVGFYPATHQAVTSALGQLAAATQAATAGGPLCLTILPQAFLAGGIPIDSTESVVSDLAAVCHRHGVGAVILDAKATPQAWHAFLVLLARKPEEVRSAGGVQRQWKALRHRSPAILEIDFGALLRGQVGGDVIELAGVISHYLETAGVGGSVLDDPCAALRRAIDNSPDEPQAVGAVLRELRAAAQLTCTQPEQFNDVFRRAADVGEFLTEGIMAGLLERRGTPEATFGNLDVVRALVERMPDATVSRFLSKAMGEAGTASSRLAEMFRSLVPNPDRRRLIVHEAQDVTIEGNIAEQWAELARNLEAYADRRFISDEYGNELHSLQDRDETRPLASVDPPERLADWVRSISDEAVRELDLQLLADLARAESEPLRLKKVLEILQANVLDASADDDWAAVVRTVEAIQAVASESGDRTTRLLAAEVLQKLGTSPASERALSLLGDAVPASADMLVRILGAIGSALMPAIAQQWAAAWQEAVRSRLEAVARESGKAGREALRRLLASAQEPAELRTAAIRLLECTPGTDHLPALENALSDADETVRAEAFRALSASTADRASDILARGIARADAVTQASLIGRLSAQSGDRILPVLRRLLPQVDPQSASVPVCLSLIAALERAGSGEAESLLTDFVGRTRWRTPLRTWRIRSAANSAVKLARGRAAASAGASAEAGREKSR
jgi:hypothetical protein